MQFVRTARPTETCIGVADVKANERVSHDLEDDLIKRHIKAAEGWIEKRTGRAIMDQAYTLRTTRREPGLSLYYPPMEGEIRLTSASSIVDGVTTDFDTATLPLSLQRSLPFIGFPLVTKISAGGLVVVYRTGAPTAADVPADIQQAVLMLASHYYRSREAVQTDGRVMDIDKKTAFGVDDLISPYLIRNINIPFYTEAC
jgi:uncharacterized phiE125 gp8 family phage protein